MIPVLQPLTPRKCAFSGITSTLSPRGEKKNREKEANMCRRPTNTKAAIYNGTCGSLVRIQLLTLFHCNPGLRGTSADLAEAIGRQPDAVEEQVRKLAQLRILEEVWIDGEPSYRYLPPRRIGKNAVTSGAKGADPA